MRRIILMLSISLITIFTYGCKYEKENVVNVKSIKVEDKQKENKEVKETKTIVIDPGHSSVGNSQKEPIAPNSTKTKTKDVLGSTGIYTKIPEHKTTVSIGLILKEELEKNGFKVIMTKEKVETSLSNIERAEIGNKNNADLVVRIHADGANSQSISGASILIPPKNEYTSEISDLSMDYGKSIIDTYTTNLNLKNRGCAYRDDMTGFNWSEVPVVILEMGFLTNIEEDKFISDINNHEKIAKAIANGIYNCFY